MLAEAIVLIPKSANKGTEIQMDVLPLVLCKDCNNGVIHCENGDVICDHVDSNGNDTHSANWFCADGEHA